MGKSEKELGEKFLFVFENTFEAHNQLEEGGTRSMNNPIDSSWHHDKNDNGQKEIATRHLQVECLGFRDFLE